MMSKESEKRPSRGRVVFIVWVTILSLVYFVAYGIGGRIAVASAVAAWTAIGLSSVVAIVASIFRYRPKIRANWIILSAAVLLFTIGDTLSGLFRYFGRTDLTYIADIVYAPIAVLSVILLLTFVKKRSPVKSDGGSILDATVTTLGLGTIIVVYLAAPNAAAGGEIFDMLFAVFYPLLNILLMSLALRLLYIDPKNLSVRFIFLGAIGSLAADTAFGIAKFQGSWAAGGVVDIGWVLMYSGYALAAMSPEMRRLDQPLERELITSPRRLIVLATASLIAPAILAIESMAGRGTGIILPIAFISAVTFILTAWRMYLLMKEIGAQRAQLLVDKKQAELLTLASHQLRTPATEVKNNLSILLDDYAGKLTKKQREYISRANSRNDQEIRIINNILSAARDESESTVLTMTDLADVVKMLADERAADVDEKKIRLRVEVSGDTKAASNPGQIKIALSNLLDNAIKFSPESGEIVLTVSGHDDEVEVKFRDSGPGIPQTVMPELFNKFAKANDEAGLSVDGIGLGLFVTKRVIDEHRGSIYAKSDAGEGSEFTVRLLKNAGAQE